MVFQKHSNEVEYFVNMMFFMNINWYIILYRCEQYIDMQNAEKSMENSKVYEKTDMKIQLFRTMK